MLFNSYIFLFLFFPLCLAGFYLLERAEKGKAARLWLTGFSLWFYGYFNPYYLAIMAGSILLNYLIAGRLFKERTGAAAAGEDGKVLSPNPVGALETGRAKRILAAGICADLGILFYFKYYDFFVGNINALFHTDFLLKHILLPLGVSFFTFQQIGFLVDVYRGEVAFTDECGLTEYALFVSFFPQLVAGPIVNYTEMMPQFERIGRRRFSWETLVRGLYLFTLGMAKKVLLADTFGVAVDYGYGDTAALNGVDAVLVMVFYALQLYFDFSGYCDMARGLGHMVGIEIPVNFNSPYQACDIIDFWKRWHITLNRFLTRYVYIPLGGNRKGRKRTLFNLLLVFLASGLWHGAGWNYVAWGAMHGVLYVLTRICRSGKKERGREAGGGRLLPAARHTVSVAATFLFVNIAWVFFRAPGFSQALLLFGRMIKGGVALPSAGIYDAFNLDEFWYVMKALHLSDLPCSDMYLCAVFLCAALFIVFFCKNADRMAERFSAKAGSMAATALLFVWCVLSLSGVSTFLYFNF